MIKNRTRKTLLCSRIEFASTPFKRARGLMFRRKFSDGMLFVLEGKAPAGIWTFGMFISIDILWLDSDGNVLKIKENAKPWMYFGSAMAHSVLELPAGTIRKSGTKKGDVLDIKM